jgi:hypothetical protein
VLSELVMMEPHCLQGFSRLQVRALPCLSRHVALISAHCTHWQSGLPRSLPCAARHRGLHEDRSFPQHSRQQQSGCVGCERNRGLPLMRRRAVANKKHETFRKLLAKFFEFWAATLR